jgi:hypothetical protein
MRYEAGKSTEENEQDRGRHSNLPFDETNLSGEEEGVPRLGKSRARPLSLPRRRKRSVRQVSWLPDLSPSGSFPDARPLPISRVQWLLARGVPGDSGGGRAGFSPASLDRTESKNER